MGSSYLLTKEIALQAVEIAQTSFLKLVDLGISKRNTLHIVIMDPAKRPEFGDEFQDAILCEASIGDPIDRYRKIAREKARFAWMYGMPTQVGQQLYPQLYSEGMTKYGGGVFLHNIAVGASGVDYQYDQMTAEMVASACRALCADKMAEIIAGDQAFLE